MFNTIQEFRDMYHKDIIPKTSYKLSINPFDGLIHAIYAEALDTLNTLESSRVTSLKKFKSKNTCSVDTWKQIIKDLTDEEYIFFLKDSCLNQEYRKAAQQTLEGLDEHTATAKYPLTVSENFIYATRGDDGLADYKELEEFNRLYGYNQLETIQEVKHYLNNCLSIFHVHIIQEPYEAYKQQKLTTEAKNLIHAIKLSKSYPICDAKDIEILIRNLEYIESIKMRKE